MNLLGRKIQAHEFAISETQREPLSTGQSLMVCLQCPHHAGVGHHNRTVVLLAGFSQPLQGALLQLIACFAPGRSKTCNIGRPGIEGLRADRFPASHFPVAKIELAQPVIPDHAG